MRNKTNLLSILTTLIIVNMAGFLLKYFEFDTYFIFVGFRFHLSLCIPFFLVFRNEHLSFLKKLFIKQDYKSITPFVFWIVIPLFVSLTLLFLSGKVKISDPEYFYEFGLSSVFDFPVYLIWNTPQLFLLYLFLNISTQSGEKVFTKTFLIIVSLFAFEFIPLKKIDIDYAGIISLISIALISGLVVKYFSNIYFYAIFIFSLFWSNLILFGSSSKKMINFIFAVQYEAWDGFLKVSKVFSEYVLPINLTITWILILLFYLSWGNELKKG